ncbi:MAG TPA: DUF998 domain-containing protein [Ktedonobacteraceae bacterium]|nr:DUF998 domain-containing protein [Ktedonobacteraceae bacterium]
MATEKNITMTNKQRTTRLLLACGAIGPLFFILVFLIEGATRPGYSAWHNFVSSLGTGPGGWVQIANFLICGALMLCFAVGLRQVLRSGKSSVWGPVLLGIFGLALITAGIFVTDGSLGYPPGTRGSGPQTLHGMIHGVAGLITFSSLTIASFVMARRFAGDPGWKGWALYSIVTGILIAAFFIASTTVSALDANGVLPGSPTGFLQRIAIIAGWVWIALLAIRLLRQGTARAEREISG